MGAVVGRLAPPRRGCCAPRYRRGATDNDRTCCYRLQAMYTILYINTLRLREPGDSGHRVVVCVSRSALFDPAEFAGQPGACVYIYMHVFIY